MHPPAARRRIVRAKRQRDGGVRHCGDVLALLFRELRPDVSERGTNHVVRLLAREQVHALRHAGAFAERASSENLAASAEIQRAGRTVLSRFVAARRVPLVERRGHGFSHGLRQHRAEPCAHDRRTGLRILAAVLRVVVDAVPSMERVGDAPARVVLGQRCCGPLNEGKEMPHVEIGSARVLEDLPDVVAVERRMRLDARADLVDAIGRAPQESEQVRGRIALLRRVVPVRDITRARVVDLRIGREG